MRNQFVRPVVWLVLSGTLVACSESPVALPDSVDADAAVGSLLAQLDAGGGASAASVASGGSTANPSDTSKKSDPKACVFNATTKYFVCPAQTMPNGMNVSSSFQLLDAAGEPKSKFDTLVVALRRVTDMTGTLTQPMQTPNGAVNATQTMASHDTMVIAGIRTNAPVQNGSGTMSNTIQPEGLPSVSVTVTKTVAGLKIDPTPTGPKYPIAGTITSVVSSKQGTGPEFTTTQVTTYDGTSIAKTVITLPNNLGSRTCTYDMTKKDPPVCTNSP